MKKSIYRLMLFLFAIAAVQASNVVTHANCTEPNLVPWPQTVKMEQGSLPLSSQSRIVSASRPSNLWAGYWLKRSSRSLA